MGLRPLRGPPCIPPEAPPKSVFNSRNTARARVLCCGSFPHSLRSLRRSPSATRKCQRTLSLWSKSASAKHHNAVRGLNDTRCSPTPHACPQFRQVLAFPGLFGLFPAALPKLPTILRNNRFLQLQVAFRVDPITAHTLHGISCPFVFQLPPSKAGRGVAFLELAGANAEAMAGVGRICKIRIFLA